MEKILIYQHVEHETSGRFLYLMRKDKIQYDVVELWKNYKVPYFDEYTRLLVMGGPQSAYDSTEKYHSRDFEINSIRKFTALGKPVLGFCLGSQLIAAAFNGRVYQNKVNGKIFKETGFFEMQLTDAGKEDSLFKGFPSNFQAFQWHGDVFDLPNLSSLLVTGQNVRNQAFRYGNTNTYGLLFHFEFTLDMVENLLRIDKEWLHSNNTANEDEILKQACKYDKINGELNKKLFYNWLKLK